MPEEGLPQARGSTAGSGAATALRSCLQAHGSYGQPYSDPGAARVAGLLLRGPSAVPRGTIIVTIVVPLGCTESLSYTALSSYCILLQSAQLRNKPV